MSTTTPMTAEQLIEMPADGKRYELVVMVVSVQRDDRTTLCIDGESPRLDVGGSVTLNLEVKTHAHRQTTVVDSCY